MLENPRRGRQVRNFTTNVPKIVDLKSPPKIVVGCPCEITVLMREQKVFVPAQKLSGAV